MGNYLSIYRPLNILFIALAQWLCAYFLDFSASYTSISEGGVYWLILGTAACAAFGYWVNEASDITRDFINNSEPSPVTRLDSKLIYLHYLAFVSVALLAGNRLGVWFLSLFIITLLALVLYSKWLKNIALIGNIIIAALSFVSLYAVYKLFSTVDFLLILHFSILAAFVTLCRELVKDAEDMEGDAQTGGKTVPIVFGVNTLNLVVYIVILFAVSFMLVSVYYQSEYLLTPLRYIYFAYCGLFVVFPLYKIAIDVRHSKSKEEYQQLSKMLKYVLFTGILSILFF
ncbi:UbiA family prenyltransferase [Bacteroidia bacterium]|nr:UbiA family prenyltransferase [Bacteroidia bacterium]MDC1395683.1 UbiA family prenyltransferase [Bacteroidia bacterium]